MPHHERTAGPDLLRQDFRALDARETLRTTWTIEQLILIQSVQGHAHEGHGIFQGRRFPDTTLDDVVRALRLDPQTIQQERQDLIDSIRRYVDSTLNGHAPRALLDDSGRPLLGISTLRFVQAQPADVLRGLYVGGLRDDSDVRLEVERERHVRIGGGRGYLVNYARMREMGLSADQLARGEWADDIERFEREGLIVGDEKRDDPNVHYQYIRHRRGPGASDDAAIVAAGLLWGVGVAVGVFFADAIDTLEKYVPAYGDQDKALALHIEEALPGLRMSREQVKQLTYLAAVPEGMEADVPDSSLRHLLAIDRGKDMCPLEAHLLTVQGIPTPNIGLDHEQTPSQRFYDYVRSRIAALDKRGSH